ncbi:hypothetical protein D4764_22G0006180 [Takifugu flavidus]|uniref:Uncharacterized protein n=1 Tax=Takifugu flavidus TaxID=433684 RepID=A0A5C6NEJ8_9TELE|nr:hypothetical protein D4764_22G0006180 [Takifugu flavidus]
MRISTSKSESMVLARKKVKCLLRVGEEVLPQVEEFKYLEILFTSEGRMEREIDRRIGAASAKELSRKAKLSIYRSIYVPILTYGHQRWVMTERTRSRIQAAEMSFLRRVAGLSLRDRVRSSDMREELGVEPLLLHIERSQLGWLGHLARMPSGRFPLEVFRTWSTGRGPCGRPRTRWRDYISRLAWEQLGVPPEELMEVTGKTLNAQKAPKKSEPMILRAVYRLNGPESEVRSKDRIDCLSWAFMSQPTSSDTMACSGCGGKKKGTTQTRHLFGPGFSSPLTLEDSQVRILAREDRWFERGVKEAIHVKLEKPSLNRGGGLRHFLSPTYNAVLHSFQQQNKHSHHSRRPSDSPSYDPADKGETPR